MTDFEFRCGGQAAMPQCRSDADCATGGCRYVFVERNLSYADATAGKVSWVGPGDRTARTKNDPAFGIVWPEPVRVIIERDRTYPDYLKVKVKVKAKAERP